MTETKIGSQFKDFVGCVVGSVVTPWSLTQDVAGSNNHFSYKLYDLFFVTEFSKFRENSNTIYPDKSHDAFLGQSECWILSSVLSRNEVLPNFRA